MSTAAALNRQDVETLIVKRAWQDEAFRAEFLADAKGTIEKYSGQKLPADVKVVALAEDDKTIHFVIPPKPANADQLSDEDLEKVAGGVDAVTIVVVIGVTVGVVSSITAANDTTRQNHGW